eukprot:219259-Prymnesium_polylepis.1
MACRVLGLGGFRRGQRRHLHRCVLTGEVMRHLLELISLMSLGHRVTCGSAGGRAGADARRSRTRA